MLEAFQPQGNTILIAGTTTASVAVQPSTGSIIGCRISNIATGVTYIAVSPSSGISAVIPTTSTPANGFPLLPNSAETFNVAPNFWLSAITSAGTAQIFATPGFGI